MVVENEKLKKYVKRLKRENQELLGKLKEFNEKEKVESFLRQYVTTRDSSTQTDTVKLPSQTASVRSVTTIKQEKNLEAEKLSKMMLMHTSLMKRYEKELKSNMQHVETITTMSMKVSELEQKLHQAAAETAELKSSQINALKRKSSKLSGKQKSFEDSDEENLQLELRRVRKERDQLADDKKRLKAELKGLDHGFFEEVEDLKYALQQSTRLNKEYDLCLIKLCKKFGVPHPHPERKLPS